MKRKSAIPAKVLSFFSLIALVLSIFALPSPVTAQTEKFQAGIEGQGDFPGMPFVAASMDDPKTLALYWVEGNKATQLVPLTGMTSNTKVQYQLSPDSQSIAILYRDGTDGSSGIKIIRREDLQSLPIAKSVGDLSEEKNSATEQITSLIWTDNQHVIYTKVIWLGSTQQDQTFGTQNLQAVKPITIKGEVWFSNLDGTEQRLLSTAPIYRVLGLSSDTQTLYATTLLPGAEIWRMEEFALVDIHTGTVQKLWDSQGLAKYSYGLKLTYSSDKTPQVIFFQGDAPGNTVLAHPPSIWVGDIISREAKMVWQVSQSLPGPKDSTIYHLPSDFSWGPDSNQKFAYILNHQLRLVDLKQNTDTMLVEADKILAWDEKGIVVDTQGDLNLFDQNGQPRGEIGLSERAGENNQAPESVVVNLNVPFVHQVYDTADAFNGQWACGPTSAVMALAFFQKIATHPLQVSYPSVHTNNYGWYVSEEYSYQSACTGTHTFGTQQPDASGNMAKGAYGSCTIGGSSYRYLIEDYLSNHDMSHRTDDSASLNEVKTELQNGAVVILGTWVTGVGHIMVIRGFNSDDSLNVNDPFGNGWDMSYDGENVNYTWAQLDADPNRVPWYIAVGPQSTCAANGTFSTLSANLSATGSATFNFTYSGSSPQYRVHLSTTSDMSSDVYLSFAVGAASPLVETNPRKWDKYVCGRTLYWRVEANNQVYSPIQTAMVSACSGGTFTSLSANLSATGSATFSFYYTGYSPQYRVHLSTFANMSSDVYIDFAVGTASPVVETNPRKWDKYVCGRTLYWRVESATGIKSAIQTAVVSACSGGTFTSLSATLASTSATFRFYYTGYSPQYRVHLSTLADMSRDVYLSFGVGTASPVVVTNPRKWDKYTCGRTLYWQVESATGIKSAIQTAMVSCTAAANSSPSVSQASAGVTTLQTASFALLPREAWKNSL